MIKKIDVQVLPKTIISTIKKKKVCAYVRVSTMKELQQSSFELQAQTYHKTILANKEWVFAGIFADYGRSGTSTNKRKEFNRMIALAKLGEIDLIITKSVSRFSRDVIDGLSTLQELRNIGVEVYFEKENISSLDTSFDFFLTIYSSVAEEESKINSSNVLWTYRKRINSGENTTPKLYGYQIDKAGNYTINEKEAVAISTIFTMYLNDNKIVEIINKLEDMNFKSPNGNKRFSPGRIYQILKNEKYAGNMMLQKTTVKTIGTRDSVPNTTKDKVFVSNNHEGIISSTIFNETQKKLIENSEKYNPSKTLKSKQYKYSSFVFSAQAKKFYKTKVNHRGTKYEAILLEIVSPEGFRTIKNQSIFYSQIDTLIEVASATLLSNIDQLEHLFTIDLESKIKKNNIDIIIEKLENEQNEVLEKMESYKLESMDNNALDDLLYKLNKQYESLSNKLVKFKHKKVMKYDYLNNIPMFIRSIKTMAYLNSFDKKSLYHSIIALDRENLILCIHLSNRNSADINLLDEITNSSMLKGEFPFKQTRLKYTVKWSIIIV